MRNGTAKYLRQLNKKMQDHKEYKKYLDKTYHHVQTGTDRNGDKTFAQITDPIKLDECERLSYKRRKNDYKDNNKR